MSSVSSQAAARTLEYNPGSSVCADGPDFLTAPEYEKRAILASWASDACAIESVPALRRAPTHGGKPVAFDDVMDALRALDARASDTSDRYRRVLRKRRIFGRGSGQSGHGQPLH